MLDRPAMLRQHRHFISYRQNGSMRPWAMAQADERQFQTREMEVIMKQHGVPIVLLGCLLTVGLIITATEAASPARVTTTTITVKMDNDNCAKRITASLREVPNVSEVRADVERRIAIVSPTGLRSPSARALWEAVEKTGHAVVQIQGPQGKFTSKPEK